MMLVLPVAVAVLVAIVLGLAVLELAWPVLVIWTALFYCLGPQVSKQTKRAIGVSALIAFAVAYRLGPWHPSYDKQGAIGATAWFVGPLVVAAFLIALFGGPKHIRARRVRHELAQSELRMEQARLAQTNRAARKADRTLARRQSVRARTGLDVDLVAEAARDTSVRVMRSAARLTRAAGERLSQTLESRRLRHALDERQDSQETPQPVDAMAVLLDLDTDIESIKSRKRTEEILRLAEQLAASHPKR